MEYIEFLNYIDHMVPQACTLYMSLGAERVDPRIKA